MGSRVGNFVVLGKLFCFFGLLGLGDISWVGNSCFEFWFGKGWFVCSFGRGWVCFFLNFLLVVFIPKSSTSTIL